MSFLYLHLFSSPSSFMNTRQCTRSVYAYDWSSSFLNYCSLLMFLYFCGFLTSVWDNFFIVFLLPLPFLPFLSLCLCLSVSLSLCLCLSICLSLSLSLSFSLSYDLSICPYIVYSFSIPERLYFFLSFSLYFP